MGIKRKIVLAGIGILASTDCTKDSADCSTSVERVSKDYSFGVYCLEKVMYVFFDNMD